MSPVRNCNADVIKTMTKPRLSICIATYNRADYIGETLESIIPQLTDEVEIVVVDGASTDDTGIVVGRYAEACRQIRYILLPAKGGFDQDFCKAVEFAKGEYCWLFCDDDLLKPGAINTVLNEAGKGFSLIVVNAQVMNHDLLKIVATKSLKIKANEIYGELNLEQLFQRVISYMSFIGCVVIHRDLWLQREKKRYFGTEFVHVGVIFQAPLPSPAFVIAEPYIIIRWGNAQWKPRSFEIWMHKWPKLLSSFTNISEQVRQPYQKTHSWLKLKTIIILRSNKEYTIKEYKKWLAAEDSALWWRMITLIIALVPSGIMKFARLLHTKLFKFR
jgi:abequosyltransferase